jgi:DNA-binding NtrC family response regulator
MMELEQRTSPYNAVEAMNGEGGRLEFAFAPRRRVKGVTLQLPNGLVVSSDDGIRRKLAEVLRECALSPVLLSTVAESEIALARHEVVVVVCNDHLDDGKYEDIVKLVLCSGTKVPVIVVSRTGDWPEYLTAMWGGVFDYLAYPPAPEDLQQTIRNALLGRQHHLEEHGGERTWASTQ